MKPIDQTRFGFDGKDEAPGNCWAACIASILELELDELPDEVPFWEEHGIKSWEPYKNHMFKWLFDRELTLIDVQCGKICYNGPQEFFQPLCILSGPSPRNNRVNHAVVSCGTNIIHDPHPSRDGLVGDPNEWWYEFFVKV
jgi:hypothetical protein